MSIPRGAPRGLGTLLLAAVLAGTFAVPALGRYETEYPPPTPGTYRLPPIKAASDGRVLGTDGKACKLSDLMRSRITVLSFIYTRCGDPRACPFASGVLYDVHQATKSDPQLADNLQLLTFSFDPEHDTPTVMAQYGDGFRVDGEGCEWRFLTTAGPKDLRPILDGYGQRVDRKRDPDDPMGPFNHVVRVYLVDRAGMIRNIYSFGLLDSRLLLADVRTLLLEERAHASAR